MHLILRLLSYEQVIDHVLPSFTIYSDETDHLRLKFLKTLPEVIESIWESDFDTSIDHIALHILPVLENVLKSSTDPLQSLCLSTIQKWFETIGQVEAGSVLNNMLGSLCANISKQENVWAALKLLDSFGPLYLNEQYSDEFCEDYLKFIKWEDDIIVKRHMIDALTALASSVSSKVFYTDIYPILIKIEDHKIKVGKHLC